jgi:hypothetical protein
MSKPGTKVTIFSFSLLNTMKLQPSNYKGIEFVNLHKLPDDQQLLLQHNGDIERIKILIDGKIVSDCIQYSAYSLWYALVFEKSIAPVIAKKQVDLPHTIAVSKA